MVGHCRAAGSIAYAVGVSGFMSKPALDYLRAAGAVPISIVGGLIQWLGTRGDGYHWTSSAVAKPIVRRAQEIMEAADLTATAALH